ncbi:mitotic-spindle organizing protein 2-like isoform X1 [Apus apus]|uniref:mitotic-spindle organizing protein 2-like isoform X1 n=1 Tax=Apus apus TaxID=8895 RepID=UPI0021F888C3|nr:mitotic-spindle organizing protein 2-like isoform X1 [Apus apus]
MSEAAAAMAEPRLRRKQLLSAEEAELFELAQAAGSGLDPEVFRVLLDLLRMNVAPLAVFQVLKSMCAGQRLPPGPEGGTPAAPAPLPADTRGSCSKETGRLGEIKPVLQSVGPRFLQKGAAGKDLPRECLGSRVQAGCRKQELLGRAVEEAAVPK